MYIMKYVIFAALWKNGYETCWEGRCGVNWSLLMNVISPAAGGRPKLPDFILIPINSLGYLPAGGPTCTQP